MSRKQKSPRCIVIAGPNGAGETTFAGGRLLLRELDRLVAAKADFAFESTLSGLTYASRIRKWKAAGYHIEIVFLKIESVRLALKRIADRVRQGGHNVPAVDVVRRFHRGWANFQSTYRTLANSWAVYDNTGEQLQRIEIGP